MISKPTIAIVDMDYPIYYSASAGEQVWYVYYDEEYNEVARFKSADEGKGWIEEFDMFGGIDMYGRFSGDPKTLIRETEWEPKNFSVVKNTFNQMKESWLLQSGCNEWKGKCASKKGAPVFRKDISTIVEYKGNRKDTRKPHHLDHARKWALQDNPQLSKVKGPYEADDIVCAWGQKLGDKAIIIEKDKDVKNVQGCWFLVPEEMDQPRYSPADIIGEVWLDGKKVDGYGISHLLFQCLVGDNADHYKGCPGVGNVGAVNTLSAFNSKPKTSLRDAVQAVGELFKQKVGHGMEYNHWRTGELLQASWKDVFKENLLLAYMVKGKNDKPFEILGYIEEM